VVVYLDTNKVCDPLNEEVKPLPWRSTWKLFRGICQYFNYYKFAHPEASLRIPKFIVDTAIHPADLYSTASITTRQLNAPRKFRAIGQKFIGSGISRLGLSGFIHSYPTITYSSMVEMYSGSDSDEEIEQEENSEHEFKAPMVSVFQDSRSWHPNLADWQSIRRSSLEISLCKRKFLSCMVSLFCNYGFHITNPSLPEVDVISPSRLKVSDAKIEELDSKAFLVRSLVMHLAYSSVSRKRNALNKSPHSGNTSGAAISADVSPEHEFVEERQLSRVFDFNSFVEEASSDRFVSIAGFTCCIKLFCSRFWKVL
jgi:hypothetical protein